MYFSLTPHRPGRLLHAYFTWIDDPRCYTGPAATQCQKIQRFAHVYYGWQLENVLGSLTADIRKAALAFGDLLGRQGLGKAAACCPQQKTLFITWRCNKINKCPE